MLDRLSTLASEDAAHACVLVSPYWIARGRLDEARDRLLPLLTNDDLSIASRATLLARLSDVEERLGNLDAARTSGEQAVELATAAGIRPVLVIALRELAWIAEREGDAAEAVRLGTRALEEAASLDERVRADRQTDLGAFLMAAGRLDEAHAATKAAAEAYRARGDAANEAIALTNLATIELQTGAYPAAHDTFSLAIEKAESASHAHYPASGLTARVGLGQALLGLGRREEARRVFEDAFARAFDGAGLDSAWKPFFGVVLSGLAVASLPGAAAQAARLRGAVIALRDRGEFLHGSADERFFQEFSQSLVESLGVDAWQREQAAGATLTLEETIELARSLTAAASETTTTPR